MSHDHHHDDDDFLLNGATADESKITFWHTNTIIKFLWNILFACFYPIILTFTLLASGMVWLTSTLANGIWWVIRKVRG